jgi:hypothetical protein
MVCLKLIWHYPGVRPLFAQLRLGEKRVLWEKGTLLVELNRSDWFGNRPDRFWVQRNRSNRFLNQSDQFRGSRGTDLVFVLVMSLGSDPLVVVQMVGMVSLQVVSLLDDLHLMLNMRVEGVVALRWRGGTIHGLPFMVFVLLQLERVGSLVVVTVVVFVEVALIGEMLWIVLTLLWRK